MLAINAEVLLHKSLNDNGVNLVCKEFTCVEENLSFVRLADVTFDVYEDNISVPPAVHAVAKGKLITAYPSDMETPSAARADCRKLKLREINYKSGHEPFFFTVDDSLEVHSASELYAFDGKIFVTP